MIVTGAENCGNSPKNVFLASIAEAVFVRDGPRLREVLASDCDIEILMGERSGMQTLSGREPSVNALLELVDSRASSAHIEAAITHGRAASAWGTWTSVDGALHHFSYLAWFRTLRAEELSRLRIIHI